MRKVVATFRLRKIRRLKPAPTVLIMQKLFITNRKGQKIAVIVEEAEASADQKKLAFVMHGLGGFKEQPHIAVMAAAFRDHSYTAVRFDTTNTFGESDGKYEDATTTNYYEDLEDVIAWSRTQPWFAEPFALAGHSLGAMCVALYAEHYPAQVSVLAPISTVVSGKLTFETPRHADWQEWKRTGWEERPSASKPGSVKRLPWSHMEDRLRYSLLPLVSKLTMPVLMAVGDKDDSCPPVHQQIFFDAIPGPKELHLIKGAPHTFYEPEHLNELRRIFKRWLEKIGG